MKYESFLIKYEQNIEEKDFDENPDEEENWIDDQYNLDLVSLSSGKIAEHIKNMTRISIELSYWSTKKDQLKIQSEQYKNDIQQYKNNLREYFLQSIVDHWYLLNHQFLYDVTDSIYQWLFDDETKSPLSWDREFYRACLWFLWKREISWERNIKKEDVTKIITVFRSFLNDPRESSDFGDNTKLWYMQLFFSALFEYEVSESECKLIVKDPAKFEKIILIANDKCNEEFEMVNKEEEEARKESEKIANEKAQEARELFRSGSESRPADKNHEVVRMPREPLKEIQKIDNEKERKRLLAKIAIIAWYSDEEIAKYDIMDPEDKQKIEAVATLMTVRTSDSEALSICTQSTNILLANGDVARLEGFLENCSKMKMYEEEEWTFADEITNELWPKLYAVSRNIVADHKQSFTEQHRSGQKLSLYKYSPQEIRQIQFCLSIYQWNSQRVSTTDNPYPNLPEIDGLMRVSKELSAEQKLKLETNRFVYALEMNVEFNRFLFAQLNRVDKRQDKKEIVIQFVEYYHQIRDYYAWDVSKMPIQLCKDYFTTLVNYKIDPLSKITLIAPPDPFQKDSKETRSEVAISDYLLSIEWKILTAVSEVKIAEYQLKMKSLERKLKELKNGKIANISKDQLKAYESMTAVIKTADDSLSALTKKTWEYNERWNTFLWLRMLVSDKEVEDAFALAEKSVAWLSNADKQYREFAYMLKDAMYDMYVMQWDMLHRKRENYYKWNALNPNKEKNNPIQYTVESYANEADDIALSVMLLGENKFGSSYINKSSSNPDDIVSIYVTDPEEKKLQRKDITMEPEWISMRKRISAMSEKNPRKKYIEAYGFRDPTKALEGQWSVNEYTRSMSEWLDTGWIWALDLSMRSWYDAWFANQLWRDPSKTESMKFYPKLILVWWKKFVINIYRLQKQLKKDTTLDWSEYFRDGSGQLDQRWSNGDIIRFNGNMDDFSVGKWDGKYESLHRNNISDITGNNFDGIIEPKFIEWWWKWWLWDFKVYRKVEYKWKSYYFSQCITDANIKRYSSWSFDKKAAEAYITWYEKWKELFNGKDSRWWNNAETWWYRALEVTPELKSRIEESQWRSLQLVRNFPEVERCARYANTIKEKFGPLRALVEGANSGKIPQSLYELFHANGGAKINEMKNNLKELREQFSNNGLATDLIRYYKEIVNDKKFGTYIDETESQILAMLQQLESIQSQLQEWWQLNQLFVRLETLSPNNFMYRLKTDGLVLIAVIAATIAAMALTWWIASGFTGVVLSWLISGTVWVVASETFTYGVREMRSSLDPSWEKVNHSIIKTAAQQWKREEAIRWWCNQIFFTTAMSSGIYTIGRYVINPIKASLTAQNSVSTTILSGVEQLTLHQSVSFMWFLRTMLLKWTSRLVWWMPETIKKLWSDAWRILWELWSEVYEEAIQEELIARLLGDNGTYLMQLLWYVKWRNPSLDPIEHFGMTYHGENANGEVLIKYNSNSLQSLPGILRSEWTDEFTLEYDGSENPGDSDYTGNFRVTVKGKDVNGWPKNFTYYFEAVTSNIEQRKLASILNLPDGDVKAQKGDLQISLEEPMDNQKDNLLNMLRKDHVVSKEIKGDLEVYHIIGTDAEYTISFVWKTTEQIIVYDEQEIQLFGKDLLGIIRKDYAYSEKFSHGIRENETILSWMRRVVVEWKLRNEDFDNYFPLLTRHLATMSAEQRIMFATYILGRWSLSEWWKGENGICGPEVEQAHQEKNLLSKAKILRDAWYDEFERLVLFKRHICNWAIENGSNYVMKFTDFLKSQSVYRVNPEFIQLSTTWCNVSSRKSESDWNQFVEFFNNFSEIQWAREVMIDIMSKWMISYADMSTILKWYNFNMGLNMFYEKLKLFYETTWSTHYDASSDNYKRRMELVYHFHFKRSSREAYSWEATDQEHYHDELWFSQLQQIASWADSKVYQHPDDPDHVYKVYNRNLSVDDLKLYYQIMEDFNIYLKTKRPAKYNQYRFATVNHQIVWSRAVGLGRELIIKLDRIEGADLMKESYEYMDDFSVMFTTFLTGNPWNGRYLDTKYNFKKTKDWLILATDVDRIAEVLYEYKTNKGALSNDPKKRTGRDLLDFYLKNPNKVIARMEFTKDTHPTENPELVEYIQNCSDKERIEIAEFLLWRDLSDIELNIILAAHNTEPEDTRPERSDYASWEDGDKEWKKACDGRQVRRLKAKRDIIEKPEKFWISWLGINNLKSNDADIRLLFERSVCGNPKLIGKPKINADLLASHNPSLVYVDPATVSGLSEAQRTVSINRLLANLWTVRTTSLRNLLELFKKKEKESGFTPNVWTIDRNNINGLLLLKDELAIFDRFDLDVFNDCSSPKEILQMIEDAGLAIIWKNRPTDHQLKIASHMFSRTKEHNVWHCPSAESYFRSSIDTKIWVLLTDGKSAAYTKGDGDQNTLFMNEHGEWNGFWDLNDIGFTISRVLNTEIKEEYRRLWWKMPNDMDNYCNRLKETMGKKYRRYDEYVSDIISEKWVITVVLNDNWKTHILWTKKILPYDVLAMSSSDDAIRSPSLYMKMKNNTQKQIWSPSVSLHFKDVNKENLFTYRKSILAITNPQDCIAVLAKYENDLVKAPPQDPNQVLNFANELIRIKQLDSVDSQARHQNYKTFLARLEWLRDKVWLQLDIVSRDLIWAGFLGDSVLSSQIKVFQNSNDTRGEFVSIDALDVKKLMNNAGMPEQFQHIISSVEISIKPIASPDNHKQIELKLSWNGVSMVLKWKVNQTFSSWDINWLFDSKFRMWVSNEVQWDYFKNESDYSGYGFIGSTYYQNLFTSLRNLGFKKLTGECMAGGKFNGHYASLMLWLSENQWAREIIKNDISDFIIKNSLSWNNLIQLQWLVDKYSSTNFDANSSLIHDLFAVEFVPALVLRNWDETYEIHSGKELWKLPETEGWLGKTIRWEFVFDLETQEVEVVEHGWRTVNEKKHREYINDKANIATAEIVNLSDEEFDRYIYEYVVSGNETIWDTNDIVFKMNAWKFGSGDFNALNDNPNAPEWLRYAVRLVKMIANDAMRKKVAIAMMSRFFPDLTTQEQQTLATVVIDVHNTVLEDGDRKMAKQLWLTELQLLNNRKYRKLMYSPEIRTIFKKNEDAGKKFARACMVFGLCSEKMDYNCYGYVYDEVMSLLDWYTEKWFATQDDIYQLKWARISEKTIKNFSPESDYVLDIPNDWVPKIIELSYDWKSVHVILIKGDGKAYHQIGMNWPLQEWVSVSQSLDSFFAQSIPKPNGKNVKIEVFAMNDGKKPDAKAEIHPEWLSLSWSSILEYKNKKNKQTYADYIAAWNPVIVHAMQPAALKLWQIKDHFDKIRRSEHLSEDEQDILADLWSLSERKSLSTSLISKDHVFTWWDFGVGISGTWNNVVGSHELDMWSVVNSSSPVEWNDRNTNSWPEVLLGNRRPRNGYNEVVLQNTETDKLSAQFLWYKTCGGKPQISDYVLSQLQKTAKERWLELVAIEQQISIEDKTTCKFYNDNTDFVIDIDEWGLNYSAWVSGREGGNSVFMVRSNTTHRSSPMTLTELKFIKSKLQESIGKEADPMKKSSMQEYYDNLIQTYQNSFIAYTNNPKHFKISIPEGSSWDLCVLEYHDGKLQTYILHVQWSVVRKRDVLPIEKYYFSQIVDMVLEDSDPRKVDIKSYLDAGITKEWTIIKTKPIPEGISFSPDQTPKACQDIALKARKKNKKLADDPMLVTVINQIIDCSPEKRAEVAAYLLDGYTFPDNQSYSGDVQVNFTVNINGQEITYSSLWAAIDGIHMIYEDSSWNLDDEKVNAYKHKNLILLFNSLNGNNQKQSEEMSTILLKWNVCNDKVNKIVELFAKSPEQCLRYLKSKEFEQNIIWIALRKLVHVIRNPSELLPHFLFTWTWWERTFTQYQSDCLAAHIKLLDDNEASKGINPEDEPYKNILKACPTSVYVLNEMLLKISKKDNPGDLSAQRKYNELFRKVNRSMSVHESWAQMLIPAELDKITTLINNLGESVIKSKEFQGVIVDCLLTIKNQQPSLLNSQLFLSSFWWLTDALKRRLTKPPSWWNATPEVGQKYYELLRGLIATLKPDIIVDEINENIIESVYISILLWRNTWYGINVVKNFSEITVNDISINRTIYIKDIIAYLYNNATIIDPLSSKPKTQQMEYFNFLNQYSTGINNEMQRYFVDVDFDIFQVNFCKLMFWWNRSLSELKDEFKQLNPTKLNKFTTIMRDLYNVCNPTWTWRKYDKAEWSIINGEWFPTPIDLDLFDKYWKKVTWVHEWRYFGSIPTMNHLVFLYTKTKTEGVVNRRIIELSREITSSLNNGLADQSSDLYSKYGYKVASFNLNYYPTWDIWDREWIINGSKSSWTDGFFVLTSLDASWKVLSKKVCLIDRKIPSWVGNEDGCWLTKTTPLQKNNISYYPDGLSPSTINHKNNVNEYEITISTGNPKNTFIKDGILGKSSTGDQHELKKLLTEKVIYTLL